MVDKSMLAAVAMTANTQPNNPSFAANHSPLVEATIHRLIEASREVERHVTRRPFYEDPLPIQTNDLTYIRSALTIHDWFRHITAGLVWSAYGACPPGVSWSTVPTFSPYFLPEGPHSQVAGVMATLETLAPLRHFESLPWRNGWSSSPRPYPRDLYRFEVALQAPEHWPDTNTVFRHTMLDGQVVWYVGVSLPADTAQAVERVLGSPSH
jgi:hypothetical protein